MDSPPPTEELFTVAGIAVATGSTPRAVQRFIESRKIPARFRVDRINYYSPGVADLLEREIARSASPAGARLAGVEYRGHRATPARKREAPKNG